MSRRRGTEYGTDWVVLEREKLAVELANNARRQRSLVAAQYRSVHWHWAGTGTTPGRPTFHPTPGALPPIFDPQTCHWCGGLVARCCYLGSHGLACPRYLNSIMSPFLQYCPLPRGVRAATSSPTNFGVSSAPAYLTLYLPNSFLTHV